jgi:hypothetical protein
MLMLSMSVQAGRFRHRSGALRRPGTEVRMIALRIKVRGRRELETLIGHAPSVTVGEYASAIGEWIIDREHGRQFKADHVRVLPPTTEVGIERYLASGLIRGIGPACAKRLVKAFGTEVFSVIEATPAKLRRIEGIGEVRAKGIVEGWADQRVIRDIMVFLHANRVCTSRAVRIFKTYGQSTRDDPGQGRARRVVERKLVLPGVERRQGAGAERPAAGAALVRAHWRAGRALGARSRPGEMAQAHRPAGRSRRRLARHESEPWSCSSGWCMPARPSSR